MGLRAEVEVLAAEPTAERVVAAVKVRARWVTLGARWVTLLFRWVLLRAPWVFF